MLRVGVLALAIAATSASVEAQPLFDDFQAMCLKTDGAAQEALAAADAAGWMPIPKTMMDQLTGSMKGLEKADGRLRSDAAGLRFLIVGDTGSNIVGGDFPKGIDRATICGIGVTPPETGFENKFAAWAAVPEEPSLSKRGTHGYAFALDGGAHRALSLDGPELLKLAEARRVRLAFVESSPQLTMVGIALPLKEPH